jgi:hypothetical protein
MSKTWLVLETKNGASIKLTSEASKYLERGVVRLCALPDNDSTCSQLCWASAFDVGRSQRVLILGLCVDAVSRNLDWVLVSGHKVFLDFSDEILVMARSRGIALANNGFKIADAEQ